MSNNTSNYQEYTFSKLLEQYDKILVPMIQRDYAQGRTDKKATDVRNNLLNDIFSGKDVHFDLVFGSKEKRIIDGIEMNCFIPVDGQQRLTTLFLLFLYGLKAGKTNIELDLSKFSYDTRRAASDFCKSITSEEWTVQKDKKVSDVIKDSSWFMNYWEKDPTVEGMLNMLDAIHEKCKEITDYPNLNKVTFFFFDLESNGLNENLYLKMNSRGKPLTAFENLKSKIEKLLPDTNKVETKWFPENNAAPKDSFKEKWKFFMDRDWAIAFWDKDNPSKYDVNIAKFIVRFLSGYWAAFGQESEEKTIAENLKVINKKEENDKNYADYIQFEPIEKVLKLVNAFPALAYALTIAPTIKPYWSKDTIKVSDKSEYKLLSVIFTYILFDGVESAMRFAWNMAENYVSEYDNFVTYCKRAGEIYNFKHDNNIATFYESLSNNKFKDNISDQLKEEIAKAKQILYGAPRSDGKSWEEIIIEAENYAFFKGAIRCLFTKEKIGDDWEHFDTKWENAQKYFNKDGQMVENYQKEAVLLRYYISNFKKWWEFWNFVYDNNPSTWKQILLSKRYTANHKILMYLLTEDYDFSSFESNLVEYDEGYKELQEKVQNELVKTKILVESSKWSMKLNWRGDHNTYCLYPYNTKAEWKIYVIGNKRNHILSEIQTIKSSQKIVGLNFFWGWNINFEYNDHIFQWNTDGRVYLMDKDGKRMEKNELSQEKFYCFSAEEITDSSMLEESLNKLINLYPTII
jgi:hypothetical protein